MSKSKKIKIELKSWDYDCGEPSCCSDYGVDISVNGVKLEEDHAENPINALKAVLEHLGYEVEIYEEY